MTTKQNSILVLAGISALVALLSVPIMTAGHFDEPKAQAEDNSTPALMQPRIVIVAGNEDPQFSPIQLKIRAGEEVKFFNVDGFEGIGRAHRIVSMDVGSGVPDGIFDTGVLSMGESATIKMSESGVYGFIDVLWPSSRGAIIVEP
jgi:plastocyanin